MMVPAPAPQLPPKVGTGRVSGQCRNVIGWWTAVTLVVLGVALFCGVLVIPLVQFHGMLGQEPLSVEKIVVNCGGPARASRAAGAYYRLPTWVAPRRLQCILVASGCREQGLPVLRRALADQDSNVRLLAAEKLMGSDDPQVREETFKVIEGAATSPDLRSRVTAAKLLGETKPPDQRTLALLIGMLEDKEWSSDVVTHAPMRPVRMYAVGSLRKLGAYAAAAVPALERAAADKEDRSWVAASVVLAEIKAAQEKDRE